MLDCVGYQATRFFELLVLVKFVETNKRRLDIRDFRIDCA